MLSALAFLTVVGRASTPTPKAVPWFGPVGALLGAGVGSVWWVAAQIWSAPVAALVAVTADLVLTGLLHLDGLADSGDGLLPPVDRERRLHILRTPEVGAFGLASVVIILGLRAATMASLGSRVGGAGEVASQVGLIAVVAGIWALSRIVAAIALGVQPYARSSGLAERFVDRRLSLVALAGVPLAAGLAWVGAGWIGLVVIIGTGFGSLAMLLFSQRRLGGFTGDTLGAAIMVGETVGLLVAAARW